ncbi:branched-chain amino acid ABC transporter permease [Candidatus Bipolaricaulota bacterium]|nr:branched-chain amino acid ABC transporter permease [Candidatus Bipolaricaulota bacterium]
MNRRRNLALTLISLGLLAAFLAWAEGNLDRFLWRLLNFGAIYAIAAVGYNLINGVTGQFSLGPHGFMLIGAYLVTLLVLPLNQKELVWLFQPLAWPFSEFTLPYSGFVLALLGAGLLAAVAGLIVGIPALRALRGDYLAIATFGFGEIIFVLACNLMPITNGPMGIKGIPQYTNLGWSFGALALVTYAALRIKNSSYGRALRAIREDELVAESMGINVLRHKLMAFLFSAFCAGVAGGLYATLVGTVSPDPFRFFMTFYLLIIIVFGGLGSITGSVVTGFIFAALFEGLRFLDTATIPGMRMVFFAVLLVVVMIFFRRGLFGESEFSWDWLFGLFRRGRA